MEIKINFDEIFWSFSTQDLNSNTQVSSSQASDSGEQFNQNNKFKMKFQLFEESFDKSQKNPDIEPRTPPVLSSSRTSSHQQPGERLYYQSKDYINKKKQQYEKTKMEKANEEKIPTFKPMINKNTDKILKNRCKNPTSKKNKETHIFPTSFRKQQQQFTHCTFTPQLSSKSQKLTLRKDKVFEQLFYDQKFKEVRKKIKIEQSNNKPKQKKLTKQQFQNFMTRTNQYISKIQKKNQLLIETSNKYDLQTGNKLFFPQINTSKTHLKYLSRRTQQIISHQQSQHSPEQEQEEPKKEFLNTQEKQESNEGEFKPTKSEWIKIFKDSDNGHMKQINEDEEEQRSEQQQNQKTVKYQQPNEQENNKQKSHQDQQQVEESYLNKEEEIKDNKEVQLKKHIYSSPRTPSNKSEQGEDQNQGNQKQVNIQQKKSEEEDQTSHKEEESQAKIQQKKSEEEDQTSHKEQENQVKIQQKKSEEEDQTSHKEEESQAKIQQKKSEEQEKASNKGEENQIKTQQKKSEKQEQTSNKGEENQVKIQFKSDKEEQASQKEEENQVKIQQEKSEKEEKVSNKGEENQVKDPQ